MNATALLVAALLAAVVTVAVLLDTAPPRVQAPAPRRDRREPR